MVFCWIQQRILSMKFLKTSDNKHFIEHHGWYYNEVVSEIALPVIPAPIFFYNNPDAICFQINVSDRKIHTNYYVGTDWVNSDLVVYVEPKLNDKSKSQTDYLSMLFSALKHPEIVKYTNELFEIKWDEKPIEITQQQDLLTPLLVVQFLRVVKEIVRKGLKKSYYRVEQNLYCKVKGKIIVGQTIKQNLLKNKLLYSYCTFDEFGVNGLENRLLKKALVFVRRYLPTLKIPHSEKYTTELFNYIMPAFDFVSEEINLNEIKHSKVNAFYKEYEEGIKLAKLILKRFGYNITNTQQTNILTPPFWIDMSKLFELYVLGMLKDRFGKEVAYHINTNYQELDYLINSKEYKLVVDAKYKINYQTDYDKDDIRQISGYARMKSVYQLLGKKENEIIDCLVIYPDQEGGEENLYEVDLKKSEIKEFVHFYKISVKLSTLKI